MQPAQEKVSCPHCSSSLPGASRTPCCPQHPGQRLQSAQSPPSRREPAQLWASPAQTAHPAPARSWGISPPRVRGSAGSLELTQHRIRNWHFWMRTRWASWNGRVFYSLPKGCSQGWGSWTDTSWGCVLRSTAQTQPRAAMEQAQPQALCHASSSSWSITTAHLPRMGGFTHTGVW